MANTPPPAEPGGYVDQAQARAELRGYARLLRNPTVFGAVSLFLVLSLAYAFSVGLRATRGASITADEPFYLLTTQSLIDDGNLDLRDQYARESWREFFDHPDGLWRQSVATSDGQVLSPHEPGTSVLLIPSFAIDSLRGAQVQLLLVTALTFSLAYVFVSAETSRPMLGWFVTAAVGLSASAFVYSTEIYPEVPAALCLVTGLLLLRREQRGVWPGVLMALILTVLLWFGMKYAPLGALVGLYYLWKADMPGRATFLVLSALSGIAYVGFHYAVFEDLTAYSVNTVYEGADAASVLESHISIPDRAYRLWGLLVDQRFGIGRWAPFLLLIPASLPMLLSGGALRRLVLVLILTQALIATFVAITMMGWWFPGRTLMTILPLTALPLTLLGDRLPGWGKAGAAFLVALLLSFTLALRGAAADGEVTLAVDPFDMESPVFRALAHVFPNYQSWPAETVVLTLVWVTLFLMSVLAVVWWQHGDGLRRRWAGQGEPGRSRRIRVPSLPRSG